ncbi:spastin isoform X1 [Dendrobium catenatum]|uniref:spastin isoform X1 n=1 Tax=Dendrobium catenatum TaxID=906689 RepID=UPI0009F5C944|nr:spastin isoform X1 [Dendrobium catenatum]XP_020681834.1 spastin isoform X1 [Dendrobium catenatum]XP_028549217.1 spastin isoform X1 [Dendrobium catenatum]
MSFFKDLADSFSSLFSSATSVSSSSPPPPASAEVMEAPSVVNERVVLKLKGYFELAKEEIDKAVRAEEWVLIDDAITHYRNAQRVMLEAKAARLPPALSSSDHRQVKDYQQKISKWQGQVSERLQVLCRRTGTSPVKASTSHSPTGKASSIVSGTQKAPLQNSPSVKSGGSGNKSDSSKGPQNIKDSSGGYDAKLVEMINSAIVDKSPSVKWDDVAGLEKAKQTLLEMVILPTKRRDLFTGLRKPPRGLLLFGPPGNGKTMLAKAVASESEATFFNVSASSLTSKWGRLERQKNLSGLFSWLLFLSSRVLFLWMRLCFQIDSLLSSRLANENDSSRRLKSEFLVQFDGVTSNQSDLVIVIGATNKPQELDDAVLRRLVKRIYIPLPDQSVRRLLFKNKLKGQAFSLPNADLDRLVKDTEGYSGSDLQALCEEAAMMPIRELGSKILTVQPNQVRPLSYEDFKKAMAVIRPSLQKSRWEELEQWNMEFGSN